LLYIQHLKHVVRLRCEASAADTFDYWQVQGRINHGAKRAMAQGPPRRKGPPAPQNFFRLFNCHLYREPNYGYIRNTLPYSVCRGMKRFRCPAPRNEIWKIYSQENHKNCYHQSCSFWLKYAPNRLSAGASPQTPLGEFTALRQTP